MQEDVAPPPENQNKMGKSQGVMREQGWMTSRGLDGKQMEGWEAIQGSQEGKPSLTTVNRGLAAKGLAVTG